MTGRLTKRMIEALPRGDVVWDGEVKGFGCRRSKGGSASYVLKYRIQGRQRWLTIGRHGSPWTPDTARKAALEALSDVAKGSDPAGLKIKQRSAPTVKEFAHRYAAEYSAVHKKPSTQATDNYHLRNHIVPKLGNLKFRSLSRADVARFHSLMKETPYEANRCLALLRHMYTVAEQWGDVPDGFNPTRSVKKFKEEKRERYLSSAELSELGSALSHYIEETGGVYQAAAVRLLVLTGARLNEILKLRWSEVDFESKLLRLSDSKTGKKNIRLSAPAIEILAELPRQAANPYVICGAKAGAHLVNLQKPWRRIRKAAGLHDVRLHDLRHSFASIAVSDGASLPVIGALLGHTQPSTTARYAHLSDDPLRKVSDLVGARISDAMREGYERTHDLDSGKAP